MADEPIQDDHPELPPRSAPKPEREPIVIDGEATEVTPPEPEPSLDEVLAEAIAKEPPAEPVSTETEPAPASEPEPSPADSAAEAIFDEPPAVPVSPVTEDVREPVSQPAPEPEIALGPEPEVQAPKPEPYQVAPEPPAPEPNGGGLGRLMGLAAVVVVAVLIGVFVPPLLTGDKYASNERVAAIDAALKDETAARVALEARIVADESKASPSPTAPNLDALDTRLTKLEVAAASVQPAATAEAKAPVSNAPAADSALADRVTQLEAALAKLQVAVAIAQPPATAEAKAPVADSGLADRVAQLEAALAAPKAEPAPNPEIAKLSADSVALSDRVAKLETALAAPKPEPTPDPQIAKLSGDANALGDRIVKLEGALAAQKSEARATPIAMAKRLDPVAEAVAAISLAQRLSEGEPFAAEFAALTKSGADAEALAALRPYADSGAPTPQKLAAAFAKLAPTLTPPAKTEGKGEIVDTMMDRLRGLVKVRAVSEIPGDDPAALTSQISAALARGDIAAALATEAKLPDASRAAAAAWVQDAQGLPRAQAAARTLAETALKRFADAKN